jgi:hypothetical protein
MGDQQHLRKSGGDSAEPDSSNWFNLPSPSQPLREWNLEHFDPDAVICAMEVLIDAARKHPDFEAQRLRNKNPVRFRF